jgi:hypothetical protein
VWLRSGCDLAKAQETIGLERPSGNLDELAVTAQEALDTFSELRDRAATAGIPMDRYTISIQPMAALKDAIQFAVTSGSQEGE